MKFVVNVPFGWYILFALGVASLVYKLALWLLAILWLILAISNPRFFLPPVVVGVCVVKWQFAVPLVTALMVIFAVYSIFVARKKRKARAIQALADHSQNQNSPPQ